MSDLNASAWILRADLFRQVVTLKELKEIMLKHEGRISARGELYDIASKRLSPGIYEIRLKLTFPNEVPRG